MINAKQKNVYRVYLAGPDVFRPDAHVAGLSKKETIKKVSDRNEWPFTLEGLYPLDNEISNFGNNRDTGLKIYHENIKLMEQADFIAANMVRFRGPSMDTGTAFEMGYMTKADKPVFAYYDAKPFYGEAETALTYHHRMQKYYPEMVDPSNLTQDVNGLSIENFDMHDNLMMIGALSGTKYKGMESSFEAVIQNIGDHIMEHLNKEKLVEDAFAGIDAAELFEELSAARFHLSEIILNSPKKPNVNTDNKESSYLTLLIGNNSLKAAQEFIAGVSDENKKLAAKTNGYVNTIIKNGIDVNDGNWYENALLAVLPLFSELRKNIQYASAEPGRPFELSMDHDQHQELLDKIIIAEDFFVRKIIPTQRMHIVIDNDLDDGALVYHQ
jgi:nucleoside 2-deoxyribosyltransferase